jgi:hypothetical protein
MNGTRGDPVARSRPHRENHRSGGGRRRVGCGNLEGMAHRPSPRPRFTLTSALSPEEVRDRVARRLRESPRLRGIAFDHRLELAMSEAEARFWSPQLVVAVQPVPGGGARLDARFGPDPWIWALYLLAYGALALVALFATIFGLVQWLALRQPPVALYVAPAAAGAAALVFGASFVGQGLGSEQMYFLRAMLTEVVEGVEVDDGVAPAT